MQRKNLLLLTFFPNKFYLNKTNSLNSNACSLHACKHAHKYVHLHIENILRTKNRTEIVPFAYLRNSGMKFNEI